MADIEVLVRAAKQEDVCQLFHRVYAETFSPPIPPFSDVTDDEQIYGAYIKEQLVGFASVWEPDAFIHFLMVDNSYRGQGVARTLVEHLAKAYSRPLTLKCLIHNEPAMAFYQATGWQAVERGMSEDGAYALMQYGG